MKKRLLAMFLAMVMCLALMPTAALAADTLSINWLPDGMEPHVYFKKTNQILAKQGTSWYWLDTSGKIVSTLGETGYDTVYEFSEGLAVASKGEYPDAKYGFIDETGKAVIPLAYNGCMSFSDGLAVVSTGSYPNAKCGFINTSGQVVVSPIYDSANSFSEGLAAVQKDGKWGYIDKDGKLAISATYDDADDFSDGTALVRKDGVYSLIDKTGSGTALAKCDLILKGDEWPVMVIDREYSEDPSGVSGYFIDKAGNRINSKSYGGPMGPFSAIIGNGFFSEGLASVCKSGESLFGYIDINGNEVIPAQFTIAANFSEGLAYVVKNGIGGYIDRTGKMVFTVPAGVHVNQTEYSASFFNGLVRIFAGDDVLDTDKMGFMNTKGEIVLPASYSSLSNMEGIFVVSDGTRMGICVNPYYTSTQPEQPTTPDKPVPATPTNDKLSVDGKDATPAAYKIGGANYFKLRDVAMLVNGTKAQFSIDYDGEKKAIMITTGQPYQPLGGELGTVPTAVATAITSNDAVFINGVKTDLTAYKIDNANYYGIRALAKALGFNVDWTSERGMFIETDKPYSGT